MSGANEGEPITQEELAGLTREELANELMQQASERAIRKIQVKHLMDMINRAEAHKVEYRKQIENLEDEMQSLRAQLRQTPESRSLSPPPRSQPEPASQGYRHQSTDTSRTITVQRSAKAPRSSYPHRRRDACIPGVGGGTKRQAALQRRLGTMMRMNAAGTLGRWPMLNRQSKGRLSTT